MIKLVETALKYYGTNPENWQFPWCAAFLNKVLDECGVKHDGTLMARSALEIGEHTGKPQLGDIVVLWRDGKDTPWGHSGFYINETKDYVHILGGNQNNTVKIKSYRKYRILDVRHVHV